MGVPVPYYHGAALAVLWGCSLWGQAGAACSQKQSPGKSYQREQARCSRASPLNLGGAQLPGEPPISPPGCTGHSRTTSAGMLAARRAARVSATCTSSIHAHLEADKNDDTLLPWAVPLLSLPSYMLLAPDYRVVFGENKTRFLRVFISLTHSENRAGDRKLGGIFCSICLLHNWCFLCLLAGNLHC